MLILFDVGNTAVTYGASLRGGKLEHFGSCLYNDIPKIMRFLIKKGVKNKINIVLTSVVPKITRKIKLFCKSHAIKIWVAGENLPVPLKHCYPKKQAPGIDRLVCLYGASKLYKAPLLLIDFGTAITFDLLSKRNFFEGGMIIPGPELSFQALTQRAALIPKNLRLPKKADAFLGRNTYDCLASGILQGYGAMTDGLIERFRARYGKNLQVIATGGFAEHLKLYSHHLKKVSPQHSLKSLWLLFTQHKGLAFP